MTHRTSILAVIVSKTGTEYLHLFLKIFLELLMEMGEDETFGNFVSPRLHTTYQIFQLGMTKLVVWMHSNVFEKLIRMFNRASSYKFPGIEQNYQTKVRRSKVPKYSLGSGAFVPRNSYVYGDHCLKGR